MSDNKIKSSITLRFILHNDVPPGHCVNDKWKEICNHLLHRSAENIRRKYAEKFIEKSPEHMKKYLKVLYRFESGIIYEDNDKYESNSNYYRQLRFSTRDLTSGDNSIILGVYNGETDDRWSHDQLCHLCLAFEKVLCDILNEKCVNGYVSYKPYIEN